jgi:hypothetical protein
MIDNHLYGQRFLCISIYVYGADIYTGRVPGSMSHSSVAEAWGKVVQFYARLHPITPILRSINADNITLHSRTRIRVKPYVCRDNSLSARVYSAGAGIYVSSLAPISWAYKYDRVDRTKRKCRPSNK